MLYAICYILYTIYRIAHTMYHIPYAIYHIFTRAVCPLPTLHSGAATRKCASYACSINWTASAELIIKMVLHNRADRD